MRGLAIAWCAVAGGWCGGVGAQVAETAGGAAVETAKTWRLPRAWRVAVGPALEWRPYFASTDAEATAPPRLRNLDLNLGVERRWFERWRFGTSFRLRARNGFGDGAARELRPWLYATRVGDLRYVRTAQRFRTELRLRGDNGEALGASYRHRYRFALERSLAGLVAEEGEWAFNASAELLLSTREVAGGAESVGLRPFAGVARGRYEVGVEYRYERELDDAATRDHVWLAVLELSL